MKVQKSSKLAAIAIGVSMAVAMVAGAGVRASASILRASEVHDQLPAAAQDRLAAAAAAPDSVTPEDVGNDDDDKDLPPSQVEKYINAYKAMQKDHSLTADQAASKEGLTIAQFRTIEGRIERDDTLRARVRKALRNATPGAKESSDQ